MSLMLVGSFLTVFLFVVAYTINHLGNKGKLSGDNVYATFILFATMGTIIGLVTVIAWLVRLASWAGFQL